MKTISFLTLVSISAPVISQQKNKVNLMEKFKSAGLPVYYFEEAPLLTLSGYNYKFAAFSDDLKYMAVSRSYSRKESEIMDIVVVKLKNAKEVILLDTLSMIRYGRPNGYLNELYFSGDNELVAKIYDGMEGLTTLTFDVDKREIVKDEYEDDYMNEEGDEEEEDTFYEKKLDDLKRIFPKKTNLMLSDLAYKLIPVDSVGYFTQGILPNDNSIFYLPHGTGKLRLIHNISNAEQNDNINGIWGTSQKVFYLLNDKKNEYFFRYDIKTNLVTLLEKYPPHGHFSYIYSYNLRNKDVLLSFEVPDNSTIGDDVLKLFRYKDSILYSIEVYPFLKEVKYIEDKNMLLMYYMKDGKHYLDVRNLGE